MSTPSNELVKAVEAMGAQLNELTTEFQRFRKDFHDMSQRFEPVEKHVTKQQEEQQHLQEAARKAKEEEALMQAMARRLGIELPPPPHQDGFEGTIPTNPGVAMGHAPVDHVGMALSLGQQVVTVERNTMVKQLCDGTVYLLREVVNLAATTGGARVLFAVCVMALGPEAVHQAGRLMDMLGGDAATEHRAPVPQGALLDTAINRSPPRSGDPLPGYDDVGAAWDTYDVDGVEPSFAE